MHYFAKIISFVFHPLLLPTYLLTLLSFVYPPALLPVTPRSFQAVILLIFFTTGILPTLNIFFFKTFGVISSVTMPTRQERLIPFVIITLIYATTTYLLHIKINIGFQDNLIKIMLIFNTLALTACTLTAFTKISIHSLSMAAIVGVLTALSPTIEYSSIVIALVIALLILGIVMFSRLYLQAHTLVQTLTGSAVGWAIGAVGINVLF